MKKVKISTGLSSFSDSELSDFAANVVSSLTGNVNFPTPTPALTDITTSKTDYDESLVKAKEGTKSDTARKNEMRGKLESNLMLLASYVEANCQNNESILLSSGFGVRKNAARGMTPSIPENVLIADGSHSGEVIVSFKKASNALTYIAHYTEDMTSGNWKISEPSTKTKITLSGLSKGKDIWVQVKSVNPNGVSEWSDPSVLMVR